VEFLSKQLARNAQFQTIIFTSLKEDEVEQLRKEGVKVQTPSGEKWLQLIPPPAESPKKVGVPEAPASGAQA